jgi:hypothetical protein
MGFYPVAVYYNKTQHTNNTHHTNNHSTQNYSNNKGHTTHNELQKPDIGNIRGLNLAVVKLTTVQVTKLPLWHKIRKIDMICLAKHVLTEDLYIVHKEECSVTCYMCDT